MSNIAIQDKEWHHLPGDEITTQLASDREKGLPPEEAGQRLDQFGRGNRLFDELKRPGLHGAHSALR